MSKNTPQAIRGTQDIFGPDAEAFAFVVETFERVRKLYRFRRAEFPVFERTDVFARSLGETTDVVSKEMYSFADRGGDSLTLRPEFTAGIARAFLTNGWQQHAPLKVATHGALFRYERPQKGRYRQFHQIDAEIIGAAEPQADVELLVMADQLLRELGIEGVTLQLNTLGDASSREAWRTGLVGYFGKVRGDLSQDSQDRLDKNPLRILDSKDPRDRAFVPDAPRIDDFLSDEAAGFFEAVTSGLDAAGVQWTRAQSLVRGLDYYRHTAFEFIPDEGSTAAEALGAQSTVLGGGRYDGLIESLGGPATPAVGWAAGIERLAMLVGGKNEQVAEVVVFTEHKKFDALVEAITACLRRGGSPNRAVRAETQEDEPEGPLISESFSTGSTNKRYKKAKGSGAWRGLAIEPYDGAVCVARLRNLNVEDAKPVRNRIREALETKYEVREERIENAHSWILTNEKK